MKKEAEERAELERQEEEEAELRRKRHEEWVRMVTSTPLIAIWINCTDHDPLSSDRLPCFMTNGEPSSPLRTTPSNLIKFASSTTSNGGSGRQTRSYDRTDRCVVIRRFVKEEGRITEWSRPIWALSLERKVIKTSNLVKHISWRMQLIFPFWQKGKEVLANVPCGCVFTRATLCVSAVFAVERWLPVCLSVCLSYASRPVVSKRLKLS